jgi:hypothetical protein
MMVSILWSLISGLGIRFEFGRPVGRCRDCPSGKESFYYPAKVTHFGHLGYIYDDVDGFFC